MKTPALALLALAALLASCVQGHVPVEMTKICTHPPPNSSTGGCEYPASCDLEQLGRQYVYLDAPWTYGGAALWVPIEFVNHLPDNADPSAGRVNTNDAFIDEFRLSYESGSGAALPDTVFPLAGFVPTNGTTVMLVPAIPLNPTGLVLQTQPAADGALFIVKVRAAGHYADDSKFVTGDFRIPVDVHLTGFVADPTCAVGSFPAVCPQPGQLHTFTCVKPSG